MSPRKLLSVVLLAFALACATVYGDEAVPSAEASTETDAAAAGSDETKAEGNDETKALLEKLTITMVSEVIDERTVVIREKSSKANRQVLRLGNIAPLVHLPNWDDEQFKEKVEAGKAALKRMLGKQMIWYKAAAPEHQPPADDSGEEVVLGDIWTTEGRHINGLMLKEGHVVAAEHYQEELARDILQAEAEKQKEQSYKDLEEAIKESEREKQKIAAAEKAESKKKTEENEPAEPMGFAGWTAILVLLSIVGFSIWTGFQKPKKNNPNRKRGPLERFWMKLKGA